MLVPITGWSTTPGLASIGAVLIQRGHDVKAGYISSIDQYQDLVDSVVDFEPDVVWFTTIETQFMHVQRLAAMIKAQRNCVLICGGTYMTLAPEALQEEDSQPLDAIMRGECEYPFSELVEKVGRGEDYHKTRNLAYVDPENGRLVMNPLRPAIENLEELPHPNTELFDYQKMIDEHNMAIMHFS